jgi:hypothetical protein
MAALRNTGYDGHYPSLMLSAQAELEASNHNMEYFNWSRVSVSDQRILMLSGGVHPTTDSSRPDVSTGKFSSNFLMKNLPTHCFRERYAYENEDS